MIALIALVLKVLVMVLPTSAIEPVMVIPPMPIESPIMGEEYEWSEYHSDAVKEYADEFTALFNELECKHAKNGALMIRRGNSGSYKFCKKG